MERTKYLEPKYSLALDELVELLKDKYGSVGGTSVAAGSLYQGGGFIYESQSSKGHEPLRIVRNPSRKRDFASAEKPERPP